MSEQVDPYCPEHGAQPTTYDECSCEERARMNARPHTPVRQLLIPLDYTYDRETQLNRGRAYVDVPVQYNPDLPVRGERRVQPYGPCPIVLREPNDQVLLHEILHVVIAGYGRPDDPHEHRLVNRIEVALWETGWRMTDQRHEREAS